MAFLSTWANSIGLSIATDYAKQAVKVGINHLLYMFCLKQFVQELDKEERSLGVIQLDVCGIVDSERRNTNEPYQHVENWISRTDEEMRKAHVLQNEIKAHVPQNEIEEGRKCINGWCADCLWRYQKGKEADKLTGILKTLKEERSQFPKLVHEAVLPNIEFLRTEDFMLSKASRSALSHIMDALKTDDIHMIGLHGMPGVGKTTLAKKVKEEAERRQLFDEFVIITVTEKPDMNAIRDRIAEQLLLKFDNGSSGELKASKLMLRLQDKKKKLIVLDDMWDELKLKEIGIPSGNDLKDCKFLLTTRRLHVCEIMKCEPKILLELLTEDEAWNLMKMAANVKDDSSVAKMVAKECGGLPIAIVSVGKALRGKTPNAWERALKKIQEGEYQEIRDMDKETNAYKCLKFSYDELKFEETRRCLLLCSLYPEDHEICVEDLARYALGLGLYQEAGSIKDTMIDVMDAIEELKDSHLLLDATSEGHVKMHDLVRDVVLSIGKNNPLEIMLIFSGRKIVLRHETFKDMEKLKVVAVEEGMLSLQSLQHLTNLQMLQLNCEVVREEKATNNLAWFQNLGRLKILSLPDSLTRELPYEIRELNDLKLLELPLYHDIDRIPSNVIGNLRNLEELHLGNFQNWEVEGNASLMELNSLHSLDILSLVYPKDIPDKFSFSNKLSGYCLHLHCSCNYFGHPQRLRYPALRKICFRATKSNVEACKELFRNVRKLLLRENDACFRNMMPDMSQVGFQDLSTLDLISCKMECLVSSEEQRPIAPNAFSNLLELDILTSTIREICEGLPPEHDFLEKLRTLIISECHQMTTVFPTKLSQGMQSLETAVIRACGKLREVFDFPKKQLNEANKEYLSHLTTLELKWLHRLTYIWKGPTHLVNLKSLTRLTLTDCSSLTYVLSSSLAKTLLHLEELTIENCYQLEHIISEKDEWDEISSERHLEQGYLQNLNKVDIRYCDKLEYVFPVSIARGLSRLEHVALWFNDGLKQVVWNGDEYEKAETQAPSEIGYFFSSHYAAGCPSLCHVEIRHCDRLWMHSLIRVSWKTLTTSELSAPNALNIPLEELILENCLKVEHIITEENDKEDDNHMEKDTIPTQPQHVYFLNLTKIMIFKCHKLKILLPIKVVRGLPHLQKFLVCWCNGLEAIFGSEDEADINDNKAKIVQIPSLLDLYLFSLPSLRTFCPKGYHFIFPSLKELKVESCPEMEFSFFASSDASVHAKIQEPAPAQETNTLVFFPPSSQNDGDFKWIREDLKWIQKKY